MNNLNLTFSLLQQASSEASMDKLNYWIICRYKIMIKLSTQCTPLLFTRWWGWSSSLSSCFSSFLIRTVRRSPVSSCLWSGQSQPTGDVEVLIQIKLYEIVPNCPLTKILIGFSLFIYCNFYQPKSKIASTVFSTKFAFYLSFWWLKIAGGRPVTKSCSWWEHFSSGKRNMIQYKTGTVWSSTSGFMVFGSRHWGLFPFHWEIRFIFFPFSLTGNDTPSLR